MRNNLIGISGKIGSGKDIVGKIIKCIDAGYSKKLTSEVLISDIPDMKFVPFSDESKWEIKKFADKLKLGLENDFPNEFNKDLWENPSKGYREKIMPSLAITRRKALQLRGEKMRDINENYWVNALMNEYNPINKPFKSGNYCGACKNCRSVMTSVDKRQKLCEKCCLKHEYPKWIITDVRFPNELKAVKDREGISIRVKRWIDKEFTKEEVLNNWEPGLYFGIDSNDTESLLEDKKYINNFERFVTEKDYKNHISETALDNAKFDYTIDNNGAIEELEFKIKEILTKERIIN